jgi:hypothetical protein
MSDVNEFDDETMDQGQDPVRAHMRKLEKELKQERAARAEAEAAKRELAFVKAGVPLDNPVAKYFIKGYDGEITPEAIRAAAEEANLVQPSTQAAENKAEQETWNKISKAQRAGEQSEPAEDWLTKINNTRNQDEVMTLLAQMRQQANNI